MHADAELDDAGGCRGSGICDHAGGEHALTNAKAVVPVVAMLVVAKICYFKWLNCENRRSGSSKWGVCCASFMACVRVLSVKPGCVPVVIRQVVV